MILKITFTDEQMEELNRTKGYLSVQDYIRKVLFDEDPIFDEHIALKCIKNNFNKGDIFTISDIFKILKIDDKVKNGYAGIYGRILQNICLNYNIIKEIKIDKKLKQIQYQKL